MDDLSDDDLILMYREGDADAFDTLFVRHAAGVYGFARTMLTDAGGAEEILQETFLSVARTAARYTPRGRFRSWLMRIVRNRCLNRLDAQRRRRAMLGAGAVVAEPASAEPSPARQAEANEQRALIRAAVADLPDRQREAIALYALEEMTYREIAAVLDMPINTVKTLIHRARASLARALESPSQEPTRELRRDV